MISEYTSRISTSPPSAHSSTAGSSGTAAKSASGTGKTAGSAAGWSEATFPAGRRRIATRSGTLAAATAGNTRTAAGPLWPTRGTGR